MRNLYLSLLITAAFNAPAAIAQSENEVMPVKETPAPPQVNSQTQLWLQMQASGALAGSRYMLPGQAATLVYQRYLKSFSQPIPIQFKRLEFTSSSGGSGSGR